MTSAPMRDPVGGRYSVTSCDLGVLTDQSTESISSRDCPSLPSPMGGGLARAGRSVDEPGQHRVGVA